MAANEYTDDERAGEYAAPKGPVTMATVGAERPQPRRLRKNMVIGVIVVLVGIAILAFAVAILREPAQIARAEQPAVSTDAMLPGFVKNAPKNYGEIPQPPPPPTAVPALGPPMQGDLGHAGLTAQTSFAPPQAEQRELTPEEQRERDEYRNALGSAVTIELPLDSIRERGSAGAKVTRSDVPVRGQRDGLAGLAGGGGYEGGSLLGAGDATQGALDGHQGEKRAFLQSAQRQDEPFYTSGRLQAPLSPYELKAGAVIPCALITGINSDLPGQITCQVRENVYDTVTGNHLLLPQGTRAVGEYDSAVVYGQNRVLAVWHRLILPNGYSINLEGMEGVDLSGYAGYADRVDHHWKRLVGAVVLSSLFAAAPVAVVGNDGGANYHRSLEEEVARNVGDNVQRAGDQLVSKNLNIQPTISIRPGYAINIFVKKDLVLAPYTHERGNQFAISGSTNNLGSGQHR